MTAIMDALFEQHGPRDSARQQRDREQQREAASSSTGADLLDDGEYARRKAYLLEVIATQRQRVRGAVRGAQ